MALPRSRRGRPSETVLLQLNANLLLRNAGEENLHSIFLHVVNDANVTVLLFARLIVGGLPERLDPLADPAHVRVVVAENVGRDSLPAGVVGSLELGNGLVAEPQLFQLLVAAGAVGLLQGFVDGLVELLFLFELLQLLGQLDDRIGIVG